MEVDPPAGESGISESTRLQSDAQRQGLQRGPEANENVSSGDHTPAEPEDPEDDAWVRGEIARLELEKEKTHLRARLLALQAERAKGFPIEAPVIHAEKGNALGRDPTRVESISLESKFRVVDPQPYTGKNQQELDKYLQECRNVFHIRPVTYSRDVDKVNYAQPFLKGTPFNEWMRMAEIIRDEHRLTWKYYVEFLQNKLKPQHLREIEVGGLLKKCRQLPGQRVSELVSYIESLEVQLIEVPTERQKHSHLLHALHDYLRDAIVRSDRQGKTRAELEQAARTAEQTEPVPTDLQGKKWRSSKVEESSSKASSYRSHPYRQQRVPQSQGNEGQPQSATYKRGGSSSSKGKQPDRGNRPRVEECQARCWGCGRKGHFERNCPNKKKRTQSSATAEEDSGKAPG